VVCVLQPVVANTYVLVVAEPPTKRLEQRTHPHVDVVVPNALVVVDVPMHVDGVHAMQLNGVMRVAPANGVAGTPGVCDGVPGIPKNTNEAVVASPFPV